jgi:Golgi apparatus protein 1
MVFEYQKLAAQDVRFDVPLADACMNDRVKFCGNIQPVRAGTCRTASQEQ